MLRFPVIIFSLEGGLANGFSQVVFRLCGGPGNIVSFVFVFDLQVLFFP